LGKEQNIGQAALLMGFKCKFADFGAKRRARRLPGDRIEGKYVMTPQNTRPGAQILQFPPPDLRARLAAQRQTNWRIRPSDLPITPAAFGGAWYHDAAIAESDRNRKP
jgi:hypothetical protein